MKLSPRFDAALVMASQLHADQLRKGTEIPYVSHLLAVAGIALEYGAGEDEAIAALLHDAVEDQGGKATADKIRSHFGDAVADIVLGCSDAEVLPKPPWKERKLKYVAHIRHATPSVRLISAADKLHNATSILKDLRADGEKTWERFKGGKEGSLWYYRSLCQAFLDVGPKDLGAELDRVVSIMEKLSNSSHSA